MPPVKMTRAEYEAKYGVKPFTSTSTLDTTPAPVRMTRQEYEMTYGVPPTGATQKPKAGLLPRIFGDIPSDIKETAQGFVGAARQGAQNIQEAVTKEGLSLPQRVVGATVAAPSAVVNMAGEVAVGAGKLLTTDEFEKAITAKIGEGVQNVADTKLGKSLTSLYNQLPESEKYTLSKIIAPIANVATSVPVTKGVSVATQGAIKTVPEVANTLKTTTEAFRAGLDKRALNNVVAELGKVEDKYKPIRKANLYDKDIIGSRTRIAQSGVLENAVDNTGTLRTQEAINAYRTMPITRDGLSLKDVEDVVRKNLENENKTVNLNELRREMEIALTNTKGLEGADLAAALKGVEKELRGLAVRADELGNVPLVKIQDAKLSTTANIDFNTPAQTKTYRKAVARVYKEMIEAKSDLDVKSVNSELAKYYKDIERLERLDGSKVEGGKLGKYTAALTGTAIGMGAGSVGGGFGSAVGGIVGGEIGALLKGRSMSQTFRGGGQGVPENAILQQAQARAKAGAQVNLKVPDKKVGAPKNVPKTKEIQKIEGQINRNIEMQKKAIKAGDFALVAKLKEIYQFLIEKLKEQVRFVRENIKSESGKLDLFGKGDGQSIPLQRNQRNTTTPAKTNDISKTIEPDTQSVKADVEDIIKKAEEGTNAIKLSQTQKNTLAVLHNLTSDKLKFAEEIGGLVNPSIAVLKPSLNDFDNFGDITLIADKEFLFSGRGKTFAADVYSPRFPQVDTVATDYDKFKKTIKKYVGDEYVDDESFYRVAKYNDAFKEAFEKNLQLPPRERINEFPEFIEMIAEEAGLKKRIFDGLTPSGKKKYKEVRAETVSKMMTKQGVRSGETSFYGLPSIRSMVAPEFRSTSAIKRAEDRLVSKESFTEINESYQKRFSELMDELVSYYRYDKKSFGTYDDIGRGIGEYFSGNKRVLDDLFEELPPEVKNKLDLFGMDLSQMPTEYFETKFTRVVDLSEFNHAVIPNSTPESVKNILKKKGIDFTEYKIGDGNQSEAIRKAVMEKGLLFGLGAFVFYEANQ